MSRPQQQQQASSSGDAGPASTSRTASETGTTGSTSVGRDPVTAMQSTSTTGVDSNNDLNKNEKESVDPSSTSTTLASSSSSIPLDTTVPEDLPSWVPPVWLGNLVLDGGAAVSTTGGSSAAGGSNPGGAGGNSTNLTTSTTKYTLSKSNTTLSAAHPHYNRSPHVFTIPIPGVPKALRQLVQEKLHAKELQQLHQLNHKLYEQKSRCAALQAKVHHLERLKERAIQQARETAQQQKELACAKLERELREQYQQSKAQREMEWRHKIEQECRHEQEQEKALSSTLEVGTHQSNKRQRDENDRAGAQDGNDTADGLSEPPAQRFKLNPPETEPGDEKPQENQRLLPSSAFLQAQEQEQEASKVAAQKQQALEQAQLHLDQLQEKRSEIVWLLKHVIKAEEKRKAKSSHKPDEANQFTSKGA